MDGPPIKSLFDSPQRQAGIVAARASGGRRKRIMELLEKEGPLAIFEIAEKLGVYDHQIAGRFSELEADGLIQRMGQTRIKPSTGCAAELYRRSTGILPVNPAHGQHAHATLIIDGEKYDQDTCGEQDRSDDRPGIGYSRDAAAGGLRLSIRVGLVECEGCGRPLKQVVEPASAQGQPAKKTFRCGTPDCRRSWRLMIVEEPGGVELLAMVEDWDKIKQEHI